MTTIGTIGVLSGQLARYAAFVQCLLALEQPADTAVLWESSGAAIWTARNRLATTFVGDWLWLLDDDLVFAPDTLLRLLAHFANPHVDAIAPLALARFPPCAPLVDPPASADGAPLVTLPEHGLHEIGTARAALLVRRHVFETLVPPSFAPGDLDEDPDPGGLVFFCDQLRRAGFRLCCDFDLPIGHIAPVAVWPARTPAGTAIQWIFNGVDNPTNAAAIVADYNRTAPGEDAIARTPGTFVPAMPDIGDRPQPGAEALDVPGAEHR